MRQVGKTPIQRFRLADAEWQQLGVLAAAAGADRSAVLREFVAWWTREPGARLPARPTPEAAAAARRRVAGEQELLERGPELRRGRRDVNG